MQPLELTLTLTIALFWMAWFIYGLPVTQRWRVLWAGTVVVCALQIIFEGHRWHMSGAYFAVLMAGPLVFGSLRRRVWERRTITVASLLACAMTAFAASAFPVFHLPALAGPYQVGTVTIDLSLPVFIAGTRELAPARTIVVQLFYPADIRPADKHAPYMPDGLVTRFKPQLAMVHNYAFLNANVSRAEPNYPILIYSHSWNGNRLEDSYLTQDLASRGFMVACIDDPLDTPITAFADGHVERHPGDRFLDFTSEEVFNATLLNGEKQLSRRVSDVRQVLDTLTYMSEKDISNKFYTRLDIANTGILGFSFGGTTAAEVCRVDARFKAGVNMDGFEFGFGADSGVRQPFMVATDDEPPPSAAEIHSTDSSQKRSAMFILTDYKNILLSLAANHGYVLIIRGATHENFSDSPLYSRIRSYTKGGPIAPRRAMQITDSYVAAFFDVYLRNGHKTLSSFPQFPDAQLFSGRQAIEQLVPNY